MKQKQPQSNPEWMALDNAAKIYPAARRKNWTALFRLSAELTEPVEPDVLTAALACALSRFPSFSQKLKSGLFWYYLERNDNTPAVRPDVANPCVRLDPNENQGFLFRVRYYDRRIAVEIFHALTDGTGGITFLKTLVAEYLRLKYGAEIPRDDGILDCTETPAPDETEDAFFKYAKQATRPRRESNSYFIRGTDVSDNFIHITTGILPVSVLVSHAREKGVSLTEYLAAAMIASIDLLQRRTGRRHKHLKPVKVSIPVNLRRFYPTHTMRNFSSYVNPGIDPRYGIYEFDEILSAVHHFMGSEVTEKLLNAKFATNVRAESHPALRLLPLFIKNIALRFSFNLFGDRKTCTCISNLGTVVLPPEMARYVTRMDLILGPLSRNHVVCGVLSYNGNLMFNITRTIRESMVEREFFRFLVRLGIPVKIESNQR